MLSIQKSHKHRGKCTPNALPCRINHNGRAEVSKRYWTPTKRNDGKTVSYFRGRQLHGRTVKIPPQYKGAVLSTTEMPQATQALSHSYTGGSQGEEGEEVREGIMEELADFDEFVIWGHVALPDETTDPYLRAIEEYTAFAEVLRVMTTIAPQDITYDVPDPTDWKGTALDGLAAVESPMRCQICKEFMTTPMMTSCGHTFCSLCIRRCLANDGLCPACRTPDQEFKLRANKSMGEVIESFKQIRGPALEFARMPPVSSDSRSQKRKRDTSTGNGHDLEKRRTRSSTRIASQEPLESPVEATYIEQSDGINDDGLVACPICSTRMKEVLVDRHIETSCPSPGDHSSRIPNNISSHPLTTNPRLQQPSFKPTTLPTLTYGLLNDTSLRKKLKELGISSTGNRQALERRHKEWLAIWNANCDAPKPRSKAELLRELDTWEKIQAGPGSSRSYTLGSGGLPIASKDFDSAAWSSKHGSAYRNLIEEAGRNRRQKSSGEATSTSEPTGATHDVPGDNFNDGAGNCAD
ncbi:hypothetical protein V492_00552 [Pseudogymnoascus sp. VKM F-4246]|nr:hypothetical protein V492_00552 [Pseudogymnoascus sp. VKM F-4246]